MSVLSVSNLSLYLSEELSRQIMNCAKDLAQRAIMSCGEQYNFDGEEAVRLLGLENVKIERQKPLAEKKVKEVVSKAAFPLPYNGEFNSSLCFGLRQNNGLYTQCQSARKGECSFCKACQVQADKNGGVPEYGTIQQRNAVGIFEYTDPKGRKPVSYTKVMKKYKVSEEQVLAEAGKLGMEINGEHFVAPEADSKRGRPKVAEKVSEPKGPKGRPKKTKKVLEIAGDEHEDLFAAMVANAQETESSDDESEAMEMPTKKKSSGKSDEEKEAEKAAKEEAKAAKEAQRLKEKAEKEAKLAAEKEEKASKLAAEKAEKEAKLAAEKEEKAAKEAQRLKEKAEKEAKKAAEKAEKESKKAALEEAKAAKETKKSSKKAVKEEPAAKEPVEEEEEEQIKVNGVKVDGKKYYRSTVGIMYDYHELKVNQNQVVVGKWNEAQQKIDFTQDSDSELEEEEEEN